MQKSFHPSVLESSFKIFVAWTKRFISNPGSYIQESVYQPKQSMHWQNYGSLQIPCMLLHSIVLFSPSTEETEGPVLSNLFSKQRPFSFSF